MKQVAENIFLIERNNKRVVSIRLDYDTISKYDKLVALLNMYYGVKITRSDVMRAILTRAVEHFLIDHRALYIIIKNVRT